MLKIRYYKARICGHPVKHFYTKRCWDCWKPEMSEARKGVTKNITKRGEAHHSWRGGRIVHGYSGYVLVKRPDHPNCQKSGYIFEHRLVMEEHLGRLLTKGEEVHHLDGNKSNNDLSNLMLFASHSDHIAYEHKVGQRKC